MHQIMHFPPHHMDPDGREDSRGEEVISMLQVLHRGPGEDV